MLARFLADESGATAVEYGLIAVLVAIAIIAVLGEVGGGLAGLFGTVEDKVNAAKPAP